jgi:type II secretory pathway pseudopilin PulG
VSLAIVRRSSGFTLVEVLVAALLLIVAAAGAAQLTVIAAESCRAARARTMTVSLAAQKMEQLRSLLWAQDAGGGARSDTSTDASRDPFASGGTGLSPTPPGTLDANVSGYVDFVDAAGRWIGAGPDPPAGAVYVRRWAVLRLDADPLDTLALVVLATTTRAERGASARPPPRGRLPDDTVLVSVKTRQASSP